MVVTNEIFYGFVCHGHHFCFMEDIDMINQKKRDAIIKLFKRVLIEDGINPVKRDKLFKSGIYLVDEAVNYLTANDSNTLVSCYGNQYIDQINRSTLHRSIKAVDIMDIEELRLHQALHYLSVFSHQEDGSCFVSVPVDKESTYLPNEYVGLDKDQDPIKFTIIYPITVDELVEKIKGLVSGIALKQETIELLMKIIPSYVDRFSINDFKNKEIKAYLIDAGYYTLATATDLIRYIYYKKTGRTLFISTNEMKEVFNAYRFTYNSSEILASFIENYGIEEIAKTFNRYRDFWILLKKDSKDNAKIINKASKLAKTLNVPCKPLPLDNILSPFIMDQDVTKELKKVTVFKKISLYNYILNELTPSEYKLYNIRNGKIFVKESGERRYPSVAARRLVLIANSIREDLKDKVDGKKFLLSKYVQYAVPTSEKNFVGNIPMCSKINATDNFSFGIHWFNLPNNRVDLDLHAESKRLHIGWNCDLRNNEAVHTGDVINAPLPNGGAEAVYFKDQFVDDTVVVTINNYTSEDNVTTNLFFNWFTDNKVLNKDSILDINSDTLYIKDFVIEDDEMMLGIIRSDEVGKKDFIFYSSRLGDRIVSKYDNVMDGIASAINSTIDNRLMLEDLIGMCGGLITNNPEEADYNLNETALTKDSFNFLF